MRLRIASGGPGCGPWGRWLVRTTAILYKDRVSWRGHLNGIHSRRGESSIIAGPLLKPLPPPPCYSSPGDYYEEPSNPHQRCSPHRAKSRQRGPFNWPENLSRQKAPIVLPALIVLPAEDLVAYQDFTNQFLADFKPVGILEEQLVQSLADTSWRLNRIAALESNLMALGFSEHENRLKIEHPEAHAAMVIMEALREESR